MSAWRYPDLVMDQVALLPGVSPAGDARRRLATLSLTHGMRWAG